MTGKTIGNPGVLIQMRAYRKTEEDIQKKQEKQKKICRKRRNKDIKEKTEKR